MNVFPSLLKDLFSSSVQTVIETRMGLLGPWEVEPLIPSEISAAIYLINIQTNAYICYLISRNFTFFFFFFHWHYSSLWALACRTMSFHFFLSATNLLHLLTPSTWRSLSTSSFHLFLGLPLLLVPSSSWVKIFLGILSSFILPRWPNQRILCPFIHFTIFSPLLVSSSSRFVRLFLSPFSYLGPYIILNIFLSKISRACSSFFVNVHAPAPNDTTGKIYSETLKTLLHVSIDRTNILREHTLFLAKVIAACRHSTKLT